MGLMPYGDPSPDIVETRPPSRPRADAARMSPLRAASVICSCEYDDGNGMWITAGVSPDLSTCLRHGV